MRYFLYFFIMFLISAQNFVQAANIIYPNSESTTIDSDITFFIGNEKYGRNLTINSEPVKIHESGGFLHVVKLEPGQNNFKIKDNDSTMIYTIYRPDKKISQSVQPLIYKNPISYVVVKNNIPLRSTPYDYGLNRLQHFYKGVQLNVIGESGNFYKVKLARDDFGWINKAFVKKNDSNDISAAKISCFSYDDIPPKNIYHIKLNKKVPYILSERVSYNWNSDKTKLIPYFNGLDLVIYNVSGYPENKYEYFINGKNFPLKGYKSYYTADNELIIELVKSQINTKEPLKGLIITLDPGHGGKEYGTTGCLGNKEKDINLEFVLKLKKALENKGAIVFLTRNDDSEVPLYDRVKISQNNHSDIFISIHNNALPDSSADKENLGTSVYYYSLISKRLAQTLLNNLTGKLGMNNDGLRQRSFAVLRNTESLCVLLELGYLIKPEDSVKLIDPEFQNKAAEVIAHSLEEYYSGILE